MDNSLISVIIPVYNTEKYLSRCLDSVINQTYDNLEVLLIDDGSTDNSGRICDEYAERDSRIRVIHKENAGQATARNLGLRICKGSYIGFVDSDDWIELTMYADMLTALQENKADFVVCGRNNVNDDYEIINQLFVYVQGFDMTQEDAVKRFLTYDGIDGSSCDKLFRRKVLEGLTYPSGYICEDLPFIYNSIKNSTIIIHTGKPLYNYFQRKGSTSHSNYDEKSYGRVLFTAQIKDDVVLCYPQLKEEAEYYYLHGLFSFLLQLSDLGLSEYNTLLQSIKMTTVLSNRYLSVMTKIKFILIRIRLYSFLRNMLRRTE